MVGSMAGERKGKAYEAAVLVALEELRQAGIFKGEIYWEQTPLGMSIRPDLTIGPHKDRPTHYLLVTNSGSAKESEKKMWRNLGELVEAKTCIATVPRVFALTFGAIKEDLEPLQVWAFDEFRWERGEKWHVAMDAYAASLAASTIATGDFPNDVRTHGARTIVEALKRVLQGCFVAPRRVQVDALWALHRARVAPSGPSPRNTSVRRGVAKLLVFEDVDMGARIHDGERVKKEQVPSYAFALGLAQKSTREAWGIEPDIRSAIECIGRAPLVALAKRSLRPRMSEWYYILRNHELVPHLAEYIRSHYGEVCKADWLGARLKEVHANPSALLADLGNLPSPPPTVWLFEFLVQLIRASTGSANGYGYAQLGEEVIERFGLRRATGGVPRIWVGGFVISDWVHRRKSDQMTSKELGMISAVLADRMKEIGLKEITKICAEMAPDNANHVLEAKVIPYRMFDPLGQLLIDNVAGFTEVRLNVCYREAAGIGGQAGRMDVGQVKHTLINWQSCTDSGRDHKKKELCGRAVGLRYHWNGKAFIHRPGIEKLILLLDGTWRDDDIKALLRAGWDDVFYPDEINKLVKAVV